MDPILLKVLIVIGGLVLVIAITAMWPDKKKK